MPDMYFPVEGGEDLHGTYKTERQFEKTWGPIGWKQGTGPNPGTPAAPNKGAAPKVPSGAAADDTAPKES